VTTRVPVYKRKIFAKNSVSAVANVRIDSLAADVRLSATRSNARVIWP